MMVSTDTPKIGGVRIGAPLWEGATEEELLAIVECFSSASYHRAGEGSNYSTGRDHMRRAVKECNRLNLNSVAVTCLVAHKPQLVTADEVIDAMLREYRSALLAAEELADAAAHHMEVESGATQAVLTRRLAAYRKAKRAET